MSARAQALLAERRRRKALPDAVSAALASMFPRQRRLVESGHKRKVVHAGRRGGKTAGLIRRALRAVEEYPGAIIPVFEQTLTCQAAVTFWRDLRETNDKYQLGIHFHETLKQATFPNKSVIALMGGGTVEQADKARGGKYPVAMVDEAQSFRHSILEYLLTDVISPATMDMDGEIIVSGTPGVSPMGTFWGLCQNPHWERHHWTARDNTSMGPPSLSPDDRLAWIDEWLARERFINGWDLTSSKYVREYLGQWTDGGDDRIYRFSRDKNTVEALPETSKHPWIYALGMDMGFEDPTSWVVWARRKADNSQYVAESFEKSHLSPSSIAEQTKKLMERYTFRAIVADTGGLGRSIAAEMTERHGIPVEAAKKQDKRVYIEHTNDDFERSRIKIVAPQNQQLIEDLLQLAWDDAKEDSAPNMRDHLSDAMLYGHREIRSWVLEEPDATAPKPGTDAYEMMMEQQAVDAWQAERRARFGDADDEWRDKYTGDPDGGDDYD